MIGKEEGTWAITDSNPFEMDESKNIFLKITRLNLVIWPQMIIIKSEKWILPPDHLGLWVFPTEQGFP